jgi:hypothetical protein
VDGRPKESNVGAWSPELLAAAATIVVALIAQTQTSFRYLPSASDVGLAAAATVIVAAVLQPVLRRRRTVVQFCVTLGTALLVLCAVSAGVYFHETSPGRSARAAALSWSAVPVPQHLPFDSVISAGVTKYGTGWGAEISPTSYKVHIDSTISNLVTWLPTSAATSHTYYAQVSAKLLAGSTATACVLVFGYQNEDALFQLALRSDGLQLAYWDGSIPARAYEGPVSTPYASDMSAWNTIGAYVSGDTVTAYVDDRKVFEDFIGNEPTNGHLTFGTLDIGSGYSDDGTCLIRNPIFRSQ